MKRLTTDDERSFVFHLNSFYAKNREVWVRNGGPPPDYQDVTLVYWIKSAAAKHGLSLTADDPEHLGEEMYDALQDGDETIEGILALMHMAAVQAAEMRGRLKLIEDVIGDDYDLDRIATLEKSLEQAVRQVSEHGGCNCCKNCPTESPEDCTNVCEECGLDCGCRGCYRGSKWEWDGGAG